MQDAPLEPEDAAEIDLDLASDLADLENKTRAAHGFGQGSGGMGRRSEEFTPSQARSAFRRFMSATK